MMDLERWNRSRSGNQELAKKLMGESGNVGYDDAGNLVETDGKGGVRIIKPASDES